MTVEFRKLFEAAPGRYLVLDPELTIVAVSDAYLRATMTERDAIVGRAIFDVFPDNPDDHGADGVRNLRASLARVLATGERDAMAAQKYDIRTPEGGFEERHWRPVNAPVLGADGKVAHVIHSVEDVTAFVQLERLRVDESSLLDAVIEHIPDMVFVKESRDLAFVRLNHAGEKLLGLTSAQLAGKTDFDFFPKDEAEFFQAKDRETLASGGVVDIPEEPIETPRGRRWLHTRKIGIKPTAHRAGYLLGISSDITEAKAAAATLQHARQALEASNKELEAFSYSVAHDLRAPLRSIDGFSQALLEDYGDKLDDEGRRYLRFVRESAQHMAQLIDDLLTLSRVTRSELRREPVDLSRLARDALARLAHADPARVVDVAIPDRLDAHGDQRLLVVVIENLIGNAWKFTSKCTAARIELGTTMVDGERAYFVRDNGAGFDMTYAGKLFGVFQRLHASTEYEGTGVGLASVQRIVHRHGGRVWAVGEVGRGATFSFTLEPPGESK